MGSAIPRSTPIYKNKALNNLVAGSSPAGRII